MWRAGRIYAKKVTIDGIKFDSEQEGLYYQELKERLDKEEIEELSIHPTYELQPAFTNWNGKKFNKLCYEPDFVFYDKIVGRTRYIDVKGFETEEFKIKQKLFDYYLVKYKVDSYLEVLKYSKTTGFVPIESYKEIMKTKKQKKEEERKYYKGIVLKQQHEAEMASRKEKREIERYTDLCNKASFRKLTSSEYKRLVELSSKYEMPIPELKK